MGDGQPIQGRGTAVAAAGPGGFAGEVFEVVADGLAERTGDIARFTESGCSYEPWCAWEAVAAAGRAGWPVRPRPPYAEVGVTGAREAADLLVFDPARGSRVLVELAMIHDLTTNKWIDKLDGATVRLSRPMTPGIVPMQIIVTASLVSAIDVNPVWLQWLGMSAVWNRPTPLKRAVPLGTAGQLMMHAWVLAGR